MPDPTQDRLDDECQQADQLHADTSQCLRTALEGLKAFRIIDELEADRMLLGFCKSYLCDEKPAETETEAPTPNPDDLPF